MMAFPGSYVYSVDPSTLIYTAPVPVGSQPPAMYFQPSYVVAGPPAGAVGGGYYYAPTTSTITGAPTPIPSDATAGSNPGTATTAASRAPVPFFLDVNALNTVSGAVPVPHPGGGILYAAAPPMMALAPQQVSRMPGTLDMSSPSASSAFNATSPNSASSSKKKGKKSGKSSTTKPSPKANSKAAAETAIAAEFPEAKTFDEDPVEIDTNKCQLIVNYLPQRLTNEAFKALFRQFGELDEAKSHIVFDFRTAGGIDAEFFAWYWKRNAAIAAAVASQDPTASAGEKDAETLERESQQDKVFAELMKSVDFTKVEKQMRSKGYGFIYYKNGASTEMAIKKLNGYDFNGRRIKVRYAEQQRSASEANGSVPTPVPQMSTDSGVCHGEDKDSRTSPISPVATDTPVLLEGAEPSHIAASFTSKVSSDSAGVGRTGHEPLTATNERNLKKHEGDDDVDGVQSEESIISSVCDLLNVDAE